MLCMQNLFGRRHQMETLLDIVVAVKNTSECEFFILRSMENIYLN